MTISAILATDENGLIGKDNTLPWHLPADLQYFKKMTIGQPILMGRNTFDGFGSPLPNRKNVVISRTKVNDPNVDTFSTLEEAIAAYPDSFIIGGGQIYKYALEKNLIDILYVTVIHETFGEGDAYFKYDKDEWKVTNSVFYEKDDKNKYNHTYLTLEK